MNVSRQAIWMVLLWYFGLRNAMLEAAGHYNGAHVIGFCSNGVLAFLAGAQERFFHELACNCMTRCISQGIFDLLVGEVIVYAIGTKEDAVSGNDGKLVGMDGGG